MSLNKFEVFEKYNLGQIQGLKDFDNILINEGNEISKNNLILDCSNLSDNEMDKQYALLEKFSLTLMQKEKTFIIIHTTFPTDKWDDIIVIPTLHEAKEYVFMEELTRGF